MSMSPPPPPDFQGAANADTKANRPNQSTPFGTSQWTQGPDGQWQQQVGFSGPLGGLAQSLQGQLAQSMGQPLDFSSFGAMPTGDAARQQAIDASYNQATSRLNPQWQQRESQMRAQLAAQGLDPNSQAGRTAMQQFGRDRNDAFGSAMNSAIGQGTAAGDSVFRNSMMSRQQQMAEMLRQRQQPMMDLQQLSGFLQMPGVGGGGGNSLQALLAQHNAAMQGWQGKNQMMTDAIGGGAQLAATLGPLLMLSDARAKRNVHHLGGEAMPSVPWVSFEYVDGLGPPGVHVGVLAQHVAAVAPKYIHVRPDGLMVVDYSFVGGVS